MATRIDHEKPEGVDEPPIVKKVRYDESAKVAEDVKKVKIDEGEASDAVKENGDISGEDAQEQVDKETNGSATPTTASPTQSDVDAGKTSEEEDKTVKPNVTGSAFGGFAAFSTSSGFSGFTSSSSTGFGSSASSGFGTTFASSKSTTTEEESAGEESSDKPKASGFGGFASFHNASTFSSIASQTTSTDGFETTASSSTDLSDVDATVEKKKPDVVVSELSEAELANGEEGETILVEKRAKLFKLVDKDYAEVGIGPFRVLQANDADPTDKAAVRFVMRRESYARGPGTKLLINAFLSSLLTCVKKTEKALLLAVLEPSADDAANFEPTTYLLRFGAPEDLEAVHARLERHMK